MIKRMSTAWNELQELMHSYTANDYFNDSQVRFPNEVFTPTFHAFYQYQSFLGRFEWRRFYSY